MNGAATSAAKEYSHLLKHEGEQETRSSRQDEVVDLEGDLELEGLTAAVTESAHLFTRLPGWSEIVG